MCDQFAGLFFATLGALLLKYFYSPNKEAMGNIVVSLSCTAYLWELLLRFAQKI